MTYVSSKKFLLNGNFSNDLRIVEEISVEWKFSERTIYRQKDFYLIKSFLNEPIIIKKISV